MFELTQIVIPKIKAEWETLAYCMRYTVEEVNGFKRDSQDSSEYCKILLTNWISTGHGPNPKTYLTLLKCIKKIDKLTAVSKAVEEELTKGSNLNSHMYVAVYQYYCSSTGSRSTMI